MIKNENKLKDVEPLLVGWLKQFEKDYEYLFSKLKIVIVVTEGLRDLETQKLYVKQGKSKTLNSKHLKNANGLSQAIDLAFEENGKINWNDLKYWKLAGKHFKEYFDKLGVSATWGGDWNKNGKTEDERFLDAPHFQLDKTPNSILKLGSNGSDVKALQQLLVNKGYKLGVDGDFGSNTDKAVRDFQTKNKLTVDGIVGSKTLEILRK